MVIRKDDGKVDFYRNNVKAGSSDIPSGTVQAMATLCSENHQLSLIRAFGVN